MVWKGRGACRCRWSPLCGVCQREALSHNIRLLWPQPLFCLDVSLVVVFQSTGPSGVFPYSPSWHSAVFRVKAPLHHTYTIQSNPALVDGGPAGRVRSSVWYAGQTVEGVEYSRSCCAVLSCDVLRCAVLRGLGWLATIKLAVVLVYVGLLV